MAANIVARELGLDLFQVDLSKIMSKYIGETEKHLATLFDEAFGRRVTVKVHFPKPDVEQRRTLWSSMLAGLPTSFEPNDLLELAREFELTGGLIRNAVLRAAYMAAARDIAVDFELCTIASRVEQKHQNMLVRGDPLDDLVKRYG